MNILLINGSPKPGRSTSGSILDHIEKSLKGKGEVHKTRCIDIVDDENKFDEFLKVISGSDIIIIAYPLYVDSLPYVLTRTLHNIWKRRDQLEQKKRRLMTIGNCGFPEADHISLSTRVLKNFSNRMGFHWSGALVIGGGGGIGGRPLKDAGGQFRYIVNAIDTSLDSILKGEEIPKEIQKLMEKPAISPFIYRNMGNIGWWMQARKKKLKVSLKHRPYDEK